MTCFPVCIWSESAKRIRFSTFWFIPLIYRWSQKGIAQLLSIILWHSIKMIENRFMLFQSLDFDILNLYTDDRLKFYLLKCHAWRFLETISLKNWLAEIVEKLGWQADLFLAINKWKCSESSKYWSFSFYRIRGVIVFPLHKISSLDHRYRLRASNESIWHSQSKYILGN